MVAINRIAARLAWLRLGKIPLASALGRRLLARPFSRDATVRVLLVYIDHMLAYPQFSALLRYEPRFQARGIEFRAIPYSRFAAADLSTDLDAIFLQSPYEVRGDELKSVLDTIKRASPDVRISYFDWFAPCDLRFAEHVEPWVDAYVKKSLLRDRAAYLTPTVGHTNLADYYSARLATENPLANWVVPPSILERLEVSPAFHTAKTLIGLFESAQAPPDGARDIDLQARIATQGSPWYSAMRQECADAVTRHFTDLRVAGPGLVPRKTYMREMQRSRLCFSPFGYGEICWRDFEAIASGAVLVKQDMSHLQVNPDIYIPFETYIPVRWDLSDLDQQIRAALADPAGMRRMAERAFQVAHEHLRAPPLIDLVEKLAVSPPLRKRTGWSEANHPQAAYPGRSGPAP